MFNSMFRKVRHRAPMCSLILWRLEVKLWNMLFFESISMLSLYLGGEKKDPLFGEINSSHAEMLS